MRKNKKSIIDLFEENELIISELYKLYSQRVTGHKTFWLKISEEEVEHAKRIRDACEGDEKRKKLAWESKFCRYTIKYVASFVRKEIRQTKKRKLSHIEALNNALRIEQSILEEKCFDLFIPADLAVKKILKELNREVKKHVRLLKQEVSKEINI